MVSSQEFEKRFSAANIDTEVSKNRIKETLQELDAVSGMREFTYSLVANEIVATLDITAVGSFIERLPEEVIIQYVSVESESDVSLYCETMNWIEEVPTKEPTTETVALLASYMKEHSLVTKTTVVPVTDTDYGVHICLDSGIETTYPFDLVFSEFRANITAVDYGNGNILGLLLRPTKPLSHHDRDFLDWRVVRNHLSVALEQGQYPEGTIDSIMMFSVSKDSLPLDETVTKCGVETTPVEYTEKSGTELKPTEKYLENRSDEFVSFYSGFAFLPSDSTVAYVFKIDDLTEQHYFAPESRAVTTTVGETEFTFGMRPFSPLPIELIETPDVTLNSAYFSS